MCFIEREVNPMATFEERLTAIEQEHAELKHDNAELKQKIELQTIAIGALVNKAALERLNERHDQLFESLNAHDQFISTQLSELRNQQTELAGKITGLQTEMHQRFDQQDVAMNARFKQQNAAMNTHFEQQDAAMNARFDQIMLALASLAPKPDQEA